MRFNLNWLLGPRAFAVVDDGATDMPGDIYVVLESDVVEHDKVLGSGLRRQTALAMEYTLREERRRAVTNRRDRRRSMTCDTALRIRLTRLAGRHSPPGSDAAIDAGCTCPVKDNARGAGLPCGLFWMTFGCPVHINKDTDHG